jgi:hypothetical protein
MMEEDDNDTTLRDLMNVVIYDLQKASDHHRQAARSLETLFHKMEAVALREAEELRLRQIEAGEIEPDDNGGPDEPDMITEPPF